MDVDVVEGHQVDTGTLPAGGTEELLAGVGEHVGRDACGEALVRVGADALEHRRDRGGDTVIEVSEPPRSRGKRLDAGQQEAEQEAGGELAAVVLAARAAGSLRSCAVVCTSAHVAYEARVASSACQAVKAAPAAGVANRRAWSASSWANRVLWPWGQQRGQRSEGAGSVGGGLAVDFLEA